MNTEIYIDSNSFSFIYQKSHIVEIHFEKSNNLFHNFIYFIKFCITFRNEENLNITLIHRIRINLFIQFTEFLNYCGFLLLSNLLQYLQALLFVL
jgi:hypothetical protein